jgi:hypothetical protein
LQSPEIFFLFRFDFVFPGFVFKFLVFLLLFPFLGVRGFVVGVDEGGEEGVQEGEERKGEVAFGDEDVEGQAESTEGVSEGEGRERESCSSVMQKQAGEDRETRYIRGTQARGKGEEGGEDRETRYIEGHKPEEKGRREERTVRRRRGGLGRGRGNGIRRIYKRRKRERERRK